MGNRKSDAGFTLIEICIVLVIIGLVVGGILVGQDLVRAAAVRSQITQIDKYQTAVNTFRGKYDALPGDLTADIGNMYGFLPRGSLPGQGDGNGLLQSNPGGCQGCNTGIAPQAGEIAVFWVDLSQSQLIDQAFRQIGTWYPSATGYYAYLDIFTNPSTKQLFPSAKIRDPANVSVYSWGESNYFVISSIYGVGAAYEAIPSLTPSEAYAIDTKIDDGFPQTGTVTAIYLDFTLSPNAPVWSAGGGQMIPGNGGGTIGATPGAAATAGPLTCYDNGGNASRSMHYTAASVTSGLNCALSFQFR